MRIMTNANKIIKESEEIRNEFNWENIRNWDENN